MRGVGRIFKKKTSQEPLGARLIAQWRLFNNLEECRLALRVYFGTVRSRREHVKERRKNNTGLLLMHQPADVYGGVLKLDPLEKKLTLRSRRRPLKSDTDQWGIAADSKIKFGSPHLMLQAPVYSLAPELRNLAI